MRHDAQIKAVLSAYLLPIMRATWVVDPAGCRDEVVQLVADDLGLPVLGTDPKPSPARRQGVSWRKHIQIAAYSHLVYGHMPFELRYRIDDAKPGGCHLDHLGQRMPWTLAQIHMNQDGTIQEVVQITQPDPLPANRLLWYVHDQEGSNWAGISMLRPVFGLWLLKHETMRVHASSIRRFGMGVPKVSAPAGATALQVQEAANLAAGFRGGDQAGIGIPQGYQFELAGMTGNVPDALAFLKWIDTAIAKMALAGLIELGQTDNGSRALGETFMDLFQLSLQSVADDLGDTATTGQDGMPGISVDLVTQNWGEDEPAPKIRCTDVGENYETTAEALGNLTRYGALSPDPALDEWIRKTWRLPERTTEWEPTSRGIPAPGAPAGPVAVPGEEGLPPPAPLPTTAPAPKSPAPPKAPGAAPRPAAARGGRGRRDDTSPSAAAPGLYPGLKRQLSAVEIRAGFSPDQHQQEWADALTGLITAYRPVVAAQRHALVEQVIAAVDKGRMARLGQLTAPPEGGPGVIAQAMTYAAQAAAQRMAAEAAHQGVHIPMGKVKIPVAKLSRVAGARAALVGSYLASQAGQHTLQVAASSPAADDAGSSVDVFLGGLSDRNLFDQLGAAMTAAQNAGRGAVLEAAPAAAGQATYVASEIIDSGTCTPCDSIDNMEFTSLAEAQGNYPNGGYLFCEGGMRCRGTLLAVWGGTGD